MERRQLEYFLAVADAGSFTAAAADLHVAQPSLSQAVKALERELGAEVFHRLPRGVTLTPAGTALLAPARQVLRDLRTAGEAVAAVVGLAGGHLDLAMLPGLTLDPLAASIGQFRRRHPEVHISIAQPEASGVVHELVRTGAAELGFLDEGRQSSELESEPIHQQDLVAVLAPGSRINRRRDGITWEELVEFGLIAGEPGTLVRDALDRWCRQTGRDPVRPAIELGRRETGVYLVLAGAGATVQPRPLGEIAAGLGAELRELAEAPVRQIEMCWRVGSLSPAAREFRDFVRRSPV